MHKPEEPADHAALTLRLARVYIAIKEQSAEENPESSQASSPLRVLKTGDQGEEHCLRGVLKEVGVGALGAVELLGFGL